MNNNHYRGPRRPPLSTFVPPLTEDQLELLLAFYDEANKTSPAVSAEEEQDILRLVEMGLLDVYSKQGRKDHYSINQNGKDRLLDPIGLAKRRAREAGFSRKPYQSRPHHP
jgi:hypothetical protein